MKVLGINGSPHKDGNTSALINMVFDALNKNGIETEEIHVARKNIRGCLACCKCFENKDRKCAVKNDDLNEILEKMIEADGILLGSPTHFSDVSVYIKALTDRAGYASIANGGLLRHKVGAAVVAAKRVGAIHAFDTLNHFFQIAQMFIVGSNNWNVGYGSEKQDVKNDEEAVQNMLDLGTSMAFLIKKLNEQ